MRYSREEMITAMRSWNKSYLDDEASFKDPIDESLEYAVGQVDHLIELIEQKKTDNC